MAIIQILDEHIANQIAAGEVVERPSSVVKELVENAIDAGATAVDVVIEEGGLSLIRVTDNGTGMDAEDLETAFFRHATSKIATGKDLFQISSLGFRGEALPSIAAVSKVECISSSGGDGLGRRIVIEGGTVKVVEDAAAMRGTVFSVKELFFNTPARLKYMKTIQTELGHISDFIYRLALSHPGIAFTLKHNGNSLIQTLGNGELLQVIAAVYGKSSAKTMIRVNAESLDYTLSGYISAPELTRSNRNGITTVVNGRYVRNYALVNAMLRAYHTLLPINRFPLAVLELRMHPTLVDVNVHPSKLEVRFSKEAELSQFLEATLAQALNRQVLIPAGAYPATQAAKPAAVVQEQLQLYRPDGAAGTAGAGAAGTLPSWDEVRLAPAAPFGGGFATPPARAQAPAMSSPGRGAAAPDGGAAREGRPAYGGREPVPAAGLLPALAPAAPAAAPLPAFPELHPIGQMHGTYIVAQNPKGLYLIDQHAAHERIHYEYYYEQFGKPQPASQELLIPITLEFTPSEADTLQQRLPLFEQAGVYMEPFGGNAFLVRSYPYWFPEGEERSIIQEMADWILSEKKAVDIGKIREKSAILCSCKASIKANQSLTHVEIEKLLERLSVCSNPYTCPHGRPIVVSFSTYELEKMFKRVM
ncbi:hypothetical protein SY83_18085 [Paenibacillus swuensis]|uniref:DNA mismatch repair protein MutL n=1 Tax=Paenibacillus swuensis TaxID=1178515 RepID=A0A172TM47_9BACL|nr:DNA mismatch repair endonuclease MutL [Paenibacillus swuensis]ANE47887.1 hypothetical protein SY83_18085 [Paenibacillus swuensis]